MTTNQTVWIATQIGEDANTVFGVFSSPTRAIRDLQKEFGKVSWTTKPSGVVVAVLDEGGYVIVEPMQVR